MSLAPAQLLRGLAVLALLVAWAVLAHFGSAGKGNVDLATALGVAPLLLVAAMLLWPLLSRWLALAAAAGVFATLIWLWPNLRQNVTLVYYVQHIGTNLALATFFGRSLFGDGVALVTRFAQMADQGVISPAKERYTRQVTIAWTLFFLSMAGISSLLYWLAPANAWSVFANLLSTPLILLMFAAEHICRHLVLPPADRSSVADTIRGYRATMQKNAAQADQP